MKKLKKIKALAVSGAVSKKAYSYTICTAVLILNR